MTISIPEIDELDSDEYQSQEDELRFISIGNLPTNKLLISGV